MKVFKAYKTELDPNNVQRTALLKHAGAARWAYNWGLQKKINTYKETGKSPDAMKLHKDLVQLKHTPIEDGGSPWLKEISKWSPQIALQNLDDAYKHFFRRCKAGENKLGFPKFKSKKRGIGSFSLVAPIRVFEKAIQLPRLGILRLKESGYLPTNKIKILRAVISERAGRWFISLQVEEKIPNPKPRKKKILGIDVGIKNLATLSDGTTFKNPQALKKAQERLRLLQKRVARRKKGSANRKKAVQQLAKQYYRISCIRNDAIHKATSAVIAKQPSALGIESLNVQEMMKNHQLAQAIADASMSEFLRQIKYKAAWAGIPVVIAEQSFPSSKTCSRCGYIKKKLGIQIRIFRCPKCNLRIDRDLNAAINLKNLAAGSAVSACCPGSSGQNPKGSGETTSWAGTTHQLSLW